MSRPDAIFALNDLVGIEIIHHLKQRGHKIPRDIAIVVFNNETLSQFIDSSVSTVQSPAGELGRKSCKILFKHINKENLPIESEVIKNKLIVGESSLKK